MNVFESGRHRRVRVTIRAWVIAGGALVLVAALLVVVFATGGGNGAGGGTGSGGASHGSHDHASASGPSSSHVAPLALRTTMPASGAQDVPTNTEISVTFSEPVAFKAGDASTPTLTP